MDVDPKNVAHQVQDLLDQGWQLHGNLCAATRKDHQLLFAQALITDAQPESIFLGSTSVTLAEVLKISPEALPSDVQVTRDEIIVKIFQETAERMRKNQKQDAE